MHTNHNYSNENCVESTIQPGSHKEITRVPYTQTQYITSLKVRSLHHVGNGSNTDD